MAKNLKALLFILFVLLVWNGSALLYAQSGIYDRTGVIPGHGSSGSLPEENIDLFTGNVTLRYRDVYLPGPNGLDVEVWRVYNSKILKDRQSGNPVVQAYHQSWVGLGWTMHMGMVHNYSSSTPIIEFPDGRLETAYPNNYGLGSSICLTRDFMKYDKTTFPPFTYPKLYFKDGTIWTFGATATITRADGTSDPVRLVTKIESPYGHHIDIVYDSGLPTIQTITDSTGRMITFVTSGAPKKLTQIRVTDANGNDRVFSYSVGIYDNGYHRLDSFTAPMLPSTTFEYLDGSLSRYELSRMTTSYGGVLEYSYADQTFYFNTIPLVSRVVSQKRIVFNPGETAAVWNFTYPTYQGSATGTVQVQGPAYTTSATHNAYTASTPWKIGLIASRQAADGSFSETFEWTYQQISTTNWMVLGTNMGAAKGPLASSVIETPAGDSTLRAAFLYERTNPKRYGLATRVNRYVNGSGTIKSYDETEYYFELHSGFASRHMMDFIRHVKERDGSGNQFRVVINQYYEETGKWGALKQVKRLKAGSTYLTWDYEYDSPDPATVTIKVDPPGVAEKETTGYNHGVQNSSSAPDYSRLTRTINYRDSSVAGEKRQDEGIMAYSYDNLGRITDIELTGNYNDIHYDWPAGSNHMTITREDAINGDNTVTRFWDGMGRDLGSTEEGEGITLTLHSRRTLDAEGRVLTESKGSVDEDHIYAYAYNAAGQITSITDPRGEETTISYQGTAKTVTDPEGHSTVYVYGDLPGLPTQVTDAMGKTALYSYDAAGRLTQVVFNGTRNHIYTYDGLDNVLTESHPETGSIAYAYNNENLLSSKTWGGSTLGFNYDLSRRLYRTTATTGGPIDVVNYTYNSVTGRVESIVDTTTGWRRENIVYNSFGRLTSEKITIPGLASKTMVYSYDWNNNPTGWKESSNPNTGITVSNSSLDVPSSVSFNQAAVVSGASYGPNKMPASISFGNGTAYSAIYNHAGMPTTVSLHRGGTTLYDAAYQYDGAGNILGIASTAPALTATFGYDALNRLISAAYSSGSPSTYSYQYDEYGNMLNATGGIGFPHTYNNKNQVPQSEGFFYDPRGNLITSGGNTYYWDAQNRLQYIQNTSGAVIGKYLYDDRGLRLMAVPPLPEINVKHDAVDIPSGGEAYLSAVVGQTFEETLTIQNLGDANLSLGSLEITNDTEDNFDFVQPSSPVLPTGSTNLIIRFHPRSAGQKIALLHIPSNDVNEADYHVNLYGNYQPEISIPQAPDGGNFDFGEIEIGQYWDQTFTIQNLGNKDLLLYGDPIVVITGPDADQFEVITQPKNLNEPSPVPVAPGQPRSFVIRYSANSEGLKTAVISIINSDWNENPYDITLLGTGIIGPNKIVEDTAFVVTSPVEGEELVSGAVHLITWTGAEEVKEVRIEYSLDNGSVFHTIVERTANTGSYPWTVPPVLSASCLVRVSSADGDMAEEETLSLEFKLKMSSSAIEAGTEGLTVRATLPDAKTATSWASELSLSADRLRYAGADGGKLTAFLDRWHTVRLLLSYRTMTANVWLDGKPLIEGVPLVQGSWAGSSPEFVVRSGAPAGVRIEDFEACYRDAVLRAVVEGEEVSQTLVRDSFEAYEPATFPRQGGWRAASTEAIEPGQEVIPIEAQRGKEKQGTVSEGLGGKQTGSESISSREQGGKDALRDPANADLLFEVLKAVVDEEDSVTGLRSFKLIVDAPGEIVIAKRLSLPAEAPFGVSEGAFSIGSPGSEIPVQRVSRSRVLEGLRVGREESTRREDDPAAGQGLRSVEKGQTAERSGTTRSSDDSNDQTMKVMSASPVGNYYIYSFDGKLLQVYDVYGALLKDYIYMGDGLIAEYDYVGARLLYYTPDQINSTRVVTDQSGNVVYSAVHNPYGGIQQTLVSTYDPQLKFSGKERDTESQLDYFGARYYDRNIYRFISVDPRLVLQEAIADPQRWNLYAYCRTNPINMIDLTGQWGALVHGIWTYRIAVLAGISPKLALQIGQADKDVDWTFATACYRADSPSILRQWHFVSQKRYEKALSICETTLNPKTFGKYLHVIQDYFAHSSVSLMGGDSHLGSEYAGIDDPYSNYHEWSKVMEMAQLTLDLMKAFQERLEAFATSVSVSIGFALSGAI